MGCNCGKNKKKRLPAGTKASKKDSSKESAGSKKQSFDLKLPSGKVESYGSKLEARAQQARRGGTLRF